MEKTEKVLNQLLVELFNDILQIEERTLKNGPICDLSVTEVHTIEAIGMYEKKTMTEVANELNITVGTLTTAVNKLIKKGYVARERTEEDRRIVLIFATKKGKLAYRLHEKFHREMINASIEGLDENQEKVLITSLEKLNNFFGEKYKLKGEEK